MSNYTNCDGEKHKDEQLDFSKVQVHSISKKMLQINECTFKIIGAAMGVHNTLGNGFQEVIYQRCLAIEFRNICLDYEREKEQEIYYQGFNVGTRRADFIVEKTIMVELKAVINLDDVHLAQAKNYLVAYDLSVGLLINFGSKSLQYKKIFNPRHHPANP